jgi:hypothetical protein
VLCGLLNGKAGRADCRNGERLGLTEYSKLRSRIYVPKLSNLRRARPLELSWSQGVSDTFGQGIFSRQDTVHGILYRSSSDVYLIAIFLPSSVAVSITTEPIIRHPAAHHHQRITSP